MRMASTLQRTAGAVTSFVTGRSRHRYQSLPLAGQGDIDDIPIERKRKNARQSTFRRDIILLPVSLLAILALGYWVTVSFGKTSNGPESCDDPEKGYICKPDQSQFWGQYSPYFTIPSSISSDIPDQCQVTFAQVLARHGARDPTAEKSARYRETLEHIKHNARRFPGIYNFLQSYEYNLGADQLTWFGEKQMVNAGMKFYERYKSLAKDSVPFVRSAGQERVVASAQNWTQGYHQAFTADESSTAPDDYPYNIVVIPEGPEFNNTLSHETCPQYDSSPGINAQRAWAAKFAPGPVRRINKSILGANLNIEQLIQLMDMCPFDTVSHPLGTMSAFCRMFNSEDWLNYDYYQTLGKYYGYTNGNPLGATQGTGYVNELISRMTNSPVKDHTNTNSTLDDSQKTFPIGQTTMFADFSHDNDISGIYAALGIYYLATAPSVTERQSPNKIGGYSASLTVPFASRAYFEKMRCEGKNEEYVRILVNDRVLPLQSCGGDAQGRCTLSAFVDSLGFARGGGNWDKCFA